MKEYIKNLLDKDSIESSKRLSSLTTLIIAISISIAFIVFAMIKGIDAKYIVEVIGIAFAAAVGFQGCTLGKK